MPRLFATLTASTCPHHLVGYKGEGLAEDNFSMIGVPFTAVDGKGADLNNELTCTGVSGEVWNDSDVVDSIQVYVNGDGWYFFYFNTDQNLWVGADDDKPFNTYFENGLPAGTSMWYEGNPNGIRDGELSVTFAGAVQGTDSVLMEGVAPDNFSMVSNPYPIAYDLNDEKVIKFTGVSGEVWNDSDVVDSIQVYVNGDGWYFFYFNTDQNLWVGADDDKPFNTYFENGITSSWWYEGNVNGIREGGLSITFFNPLKKSAE